MTERKNPADEAIRFIGKMKGWDGPAAGLPIELLPFQTDEIIRPILGRIDDETNKRLTREALIFLPRKNGKTALISLLAASLFFLSRDVQGRLKQTSIIVAASTVEQAGVLFDGVWSVIQSNSHLRKLTTGWASRKSIKHRKTGTTLKVFSQDRGGAGVYGTRPEICLFDECFTWPNDKMYMAATSGFGAKEQPLIINISTAGYDVNKEHWFFKKYQYSKEVKAAREVGKEIDPTFVPIIYELGEPKDDKGEPDKDAWKREAEWHRCNPALGKFNSLENMRHEFKLAERSPIEEIKFKTFYLNCWTTSATSGFPIQHLYQAPARFLKDEELIGRPVFGGLDMSKRQDLTAFSLCFPSFDEDGRIVYDFKTWCFLPKRRIKHYADQGVKFVEWKEKGYLEEMGEDVITQEPLVKRIQEIIEPYASSMEFLAFDSYNAAYVVQKLGGLVRCVEFNQTARNYNLPMKEFEAAVFERQLAFGKNPIVQWCFENLRYDLDKAENYYPSKKISVGRIDAAVAHFMSFALALQHSR